MNKNITEKMENGKIKVIREYRDSEFIVCFGDNWYKGLNEGYREFNNFCSAYDYYISIV